MPGLTADDVRARARRSPPPTSALAPFRVLRGTECDILPDGSLDLPDDVLAELDWVQVSLHAGQRAPRRELTARVTHAMRHPAARCLSHPTGRLIGHRPENALDLDATIETALETGVALEVNGLPDRLDLSGEHVRHALEAGVAHRLLDRRARARGPRLHAALRAHGPPRRRHRRATCSTRAPSARILSG